MAKLGRRPIEGLSNREVQVLSLVAKGYTNPEVGRELGISQITVKGHMKRIHVKLNARTRTHAVVLAARAGYIDLRDP